MRRCPTTAPGQSPARTAVSLSISLKKQIYKNRYYYLLLIPAIVYLAAISAIDTQRYEAAYVDGANRLQQAAYSTIPGITPVIIILFLLSLSNIMNAGFEQIFNLYNPQVYEVADIIDTYVYRVGVLSAEFSFGAAVGLFKNVIGLVLLLLVNALARRFSEHALW